MEADGIKLTPECVRLIDSPVKTFLLYKVKVVFILSGDSGKKANGRWTVPPNGGVFIKQPFFFNKNRF